MQPIMNSLQIFFVIYWNKGEIKLVSVKVKIRVRFSIWFRVSASVSSINKQTNVINLLRIANMLSGNIKSYKMESKTVFSLLFYYVLFSVF